MPLIKSANTTIIAEIGVNHNGDIDLAKRMIDAAVKCGADIAKFQTFKASRLVMPNADKAPYQKVTTNPNQSQEEMLRALELDESAHYILSEHCKSSGIQFLSTPFDITSLQFLVEDIGVPWIKIPSGEIVNGPLLYKASQTGLPIVLSTGMANEQEIEDALTIIGQGYTNTSGIPELGIKLTNEQLETVKKNVTLLLCTTAYPTPYSDVNLRAMNRLRKLFATNIGISDHTAGTAVSVAAVALGATIVEKHFTLDRTMPGPDQSASLEPDEFSRLVSEIRIIESALGIEDIKKLMPSEVETINIARQSLYAASDIKKGEIIEEKHLITSRPDTGATPMNYWSLLGSVALRDYKKNEPIDK